MMYCFFFGCCSYFVQRCIAIPVFILGNPSCSFVISFKSCYGVCPTDRSIPENNDTCLSGLSKMAEQCFHFPTECFGICGHEHIEMNMILEKELQAL